MGQRLITGMMKPSVEFMRFFLVAATGLIIDIAVAWSCIVIAGFSDPAAASCGLLVGMIFNYFLHLGWTFRDHQQRASVSHFLQFGAAVGVTLVVRIIVLEIIRQAGWQTILHPVIRLGISAAVAFALSYIICRKLIFSKTISSS